jgi:hypothetical protein
MYSIDKKSEDCLYEQIKRGLIINLNNDCKFELQGIEYVKLCIREMIKRYSYSENYNFKNNVCITDGIVNATLISQSLIEVYKYKIHTTTIASKLNELLLWPENHLKNYIIATNKQLNEIATANIIEFNDCIDRLLKELEQILLEFDKSIASKKVEREQFMSQIMSMYESDLSDKEKFMTIFRLVCDAPKINSGENKSNKSLENEAQHD